MNKIVEVSSVKPRSTSRRQALGKLSPDLIGKARDENTAQVTRVGLTFLGTAAFCILTLCTGDSALLGGDDKINVPLAGPVSFNGFMLLGPVILIALRGYLQIYVEHGERLDRLARSLSAPRAPSLVPLQNPLIRLIGALTFYLLLPVAMLLFAWKAAVFPDLATGLFGAAIAVITGHLMLFSRVSWRSRVLPSVGAGIIAGAIMLHLGPPPRPLFLDRAKLSGHSLMGYDFRYASLREADLRDADLRRINLYGANLIGANLSRANLRNVVLADANLYDAVLSGANLNGAEMGGANLHHAKLNDADLSGAALYNVDLGRADLSGATLYNADLSRANLISAAITQMQLDKACGNADTRLPKELTIKPCS